MRLCGVTRMRFCGVRVCGRVLLWWGDRRSMVRILLGRASSRSQSVSKKNWIKNRERSPALLNLRFAGTVAVASHFCIETVAAFFRSRRSLLLATSVFLPHISYKTLGFIRNTSRLHGMPSFQMVHLILFTA